MAELKFTYQYCGICGHTPQTDKDEMNILTSWWDPDDGYKFGGLCRHCKADYGDVKPHHSDYAYTSLDQFKDENILTDEDITPMLFDMTAF